MKEKKGSLEMKIQPTTWTSQTHSLCNFVGVLLFYWFIWYRKQRDKRSTNTLISKKRVAG